MLHMVTAPAFRLSSLKKAVPLIALALLMTGPAPAAQALRAKSRPVPQVETLDGTSLLGSYLAGHLARATRDSENAALYYRRALAKDPGNQDILDEAFQLELASGNYAEAKSLAQRLVRRQPDNSIAHIFLGVDAYKHQDFQTADEHFKTAQRAATADDPTIKLSRAWTGVALGHADKAIASLQAAPKTAWAVHFETVQRAFMADVAKSWAQARGSLPVRLRQKGAEFAHRRSVFPASCRVGQPGAGAGGAAGIRSPRDADGQGAAGGTQGRQDAKAHGFECRRGARGIVPRHRTGGRRQQRRRRSAGLFSPGADAEPGIGHRQAGTRRALWKCRALCKGDYRPRQDPGAVAILGQCPDA